MLIKRKNLALVSPHAQEHNHLIRVVRPYCMRAIGRWARYYSWLTYQAEVMNRKVHITFTPMNEDGLFDREQLSVIRLGMANMRAERPTFLIRRERWGDIALEDDRWTVSIQKK